MAPHNLWLLCAARAEGGRRVECALLYGHHFAPDGKADPSRTRLVLHAPRGEQRSLDLETDAEGLVSGFTAADPGVYTLAAEYDLGLYGRLKDGTYAPGRTTGDDVSAVVHFVHYAKTCVPAGDASDLPGSFGIALEIMPLRFAKDEIELLVQSAGRPLADCEVFAHCEGRRISRFGRTDGDGKVSFGLFPGTWMFIIRHEVPAGKNADVRVNGATLTLVVDE